MASLGNTPMQNALSFYGSLETIDSTERLVIRVGRIDTFYE